MDGLYIGAQWFLSGSLAAFCAQAAWARRFRPGAASADLSAPQTDYAPLGQSLDALQKLAMSLCEVAQRHAEQIQVLNQKLQEAVAMRANNLPEAVVEVASQIVRTNDRLQDQFSGVANRLREHREVVGAQLSEVQLRGRTGRRLRVESVPTAQGERIDEVRVNLPTLSIDLSAQSLPPVRSSKPRAEPKPADAPPRLKGETQRKSPRRPYPFVQQIAAYRAGHVLKASDFAAVHCHDISADGFSYWAEAAPDHRFLVARFGALPDVVYLTAEVKHVTPKRRDGHEMHLVGCQFLQRVAMSPSPADEVEPAGAC